MNGGEEGGEYSTCHKWRKGFKQPKKGKGFCEDKCYAQVLLRTTTEAEKQEKEVKETRYIGGETKVGRHEKGKLCNVEECWESLI